MIYLRSIRVGDSCSNLERYPLNIPAFRCGSGGFEFRKKVSFLVGENGTGKSTILEAIAMNCGFHPWGGSRNNFYNYRKTESSLVNDLVLSWSKKATRGFFLRAETFFGFANHIDDIARDDASILKSYGGKSLHKQSHGESFLSLFQHRFSEGLFLLDEPEAALSPSRQLALISILDERVIAGRSQFIIATHSPILLSFPDATIYELGDWGIRTTPYKELGHYKLVRDFLNCPERYLRHLMSDKSVNADDN